MSNEWGIRGRMPRYRLGRYGPHSNEALLKTDSPSDAGRNASMEAQNMSRMNGNIARYSQPCILKPSNAEAARDSNWLYLVLPITRCMVVQLE